jgi:restriction system protein
MYRWWVYPVGNLVANGDDTKKVGVEYPNILNKAPFHTSCQYLITVSWYYFSSHPKYERQIENIHLEGPRQLAWSNPPPKNRQDLVLRRYNEITADYNMKLEAIREKEKKSIELNKKVTSLSELNPREFEEYLTELFKLLRYEKVTLTPQMNDKGIDILMEKDGKRYAVQCKRHKGIIGSPAIQSFLGAMQHAKVSHGFFVTTSTFSLEAEKMASQHPIELVDATKLAQMIQQVLEET